MDAFVQQQWLRIRHTTLECWGLGRPVLAWAW